jgi:hypothetical protein
MKVGPIEIGSLLPDRYKLAFARSAKPIGLVSSADARSRPPLHQLSEADKRQQLTDLFV